MAVYFKRPLGKPTLGDGPEEWKYLRELQLADQEVHLI
jgi:hypothetical protein